MTKRIRIITADETAGDEPADAAAGATFSDQVAKSTASDKALRDYVEWLQGEERIIRRLESEITDPMLRLAGRR